MGTLKSTTKETKQTTALNTGCLFTNNCKSGNLCCAFCRVKDCIERCTDSAIKCKYYFGDKEALKTITASQKEIKKGSRIKKVDLW